MRSQHHRVMSGDETIEWQWHAEGFVVRRSQDEVTTVGRPAKRDAVDLALDDIRQCQ
jgi:hypothetical protein